MNMLKQHSQADTPQSEQDEGHNSETVRLQDQKGPFTIPKNISPDVD